MVETPGGKEPELDTPLTRTLASDTKLRLRLELQVARKIRASGGTVHDAEEIVSAAWELALRHEKEGTGWDENGPKPYGMYMYEIVQGQAANFRKARRRSKTVDLEKPEWVKSQGPSPEEEADRLERAGLMEKMKKALEEDSQGAIPLKMFEAAALRGCEGPAELAADLQVPVSVIQKAERRIEKVGRELLKAMRFEAMRRKLGKKP